MSISNICRAAIHEYLDGLISKKELEVVAERFNKQLKLNFKENK